MYIYNVKPLYRGLVPPEELEKRKTKKPLYRGLQCASTFTMKGHYIEDLCLTNQGARKDKRNYLEDLCHTNPRNVGVAPIMHPLMPCKFEGGGGGAGGKYVCVGREGESLSKLG